jgi:hypothetical protein
VEFAYADLKVGGSVKTKAGLIRAAATRAGATTERGTKPSTLIVHGDVAKFTDELLGPQAMGEAPPVGPPTVPPEGPSMAWPRGPEVGRKYPWWLQNKAEQIAFGINEANLNSHIADMLGLTDDLKAKTETVAAIDEMIASRDPQFVAGKISELTNDVDPMGTAFAYHLKTRAAIMATQGNLPNLMRAMSTFVPYDISVPTMDTHRHMMNFALITKMGKRIPEAADYARARALADKAWRTSDMNVRLKAIHDLDRIVIENMRAEGHTVKGKFVSEWDRYVEWRGKVRSALSHNPALGSGVSRRTYGEGDKRRVAQADYFDLEAQIEGYRNRLGKMADDAGDRVEVEKALAAADKQLAEFRQSATVWNDYVDGKIKYEDAAAAGARLDNLVAPQPVLFFQLRKHLTHLDEVNPRLLATYHGGAASRGIARYNASLVGDPLMRAWKSMVMATLGFPIRVNVGDEFWRLIPEGLTPGTKRYREARKVAKELFGGKNVLGAFSEWASRGHYASTSARALSRTERLELKSLTSGGKLSHEQSLRMAELESKAQGSADRGISEVLFDRALADFAEYATDDWVLAGPDSPTPNYHRAMKDFLRQLSDEPFIKDWVKQGMPDLSRAELEGRLRFSTESSPQGVALLSSRGIMDVTGKIVDKAAYEQIITAYANIIDRVNLDSRLRGAMESGGISLNTLSKIGNMPDGTPILWEIPVKTGIYRTGGAKGFATAPFATFYENITLPLLSTLGGKLRETFFADRYISEMGKLDRERPGMDVKEKHSIASERALEYTNTVTFSRNTTVFEDLNRNLIPFVSSYRQFMVYWAKTFVKHPFAMSAAFTYNPMKDVQFVNIPGLDMSVPMGIFQPFMMQAEFGATDNDPTVGKVIKKSIPSGNPFISSLVIAPIAEQFTSAEAANKNFAPLASPVGNVYYAYTGNKLFGNMPIAGRLTRPIVSKDKSHLDILRSSVRGVTTPEFGPSEAVIDYPWWYKVGKALGMERPEVMMTAATKVGGPFTATYQPEQAKQKVEGDIAMRNLKTPMERAAYREAHPWYDGLYRITQENPSKSEILKLIKKEPGYVAWLTASTTSQGWTDYTVFQENLLRGETNYRSDEQFFKDYVNKYVDLMGGKKPSTSGGVPTFYGGDVNRPAAAKKFKAEVTKATKLAKQAAREMAATQGGGKPLGSALYKLWKDSVEHPSIKGEWILHPDFAKWAQAKGIDPMDLNVGAITEMFEVEKGWGKKGRITDRGPGESETSFFLDLAASGVVYSPFISELRKGTPYQDAIVKAAVKLDVDKRKTLYDKKVEESFRFTSNDLMAMGFRAGSGFDNAQKDARSFYYKEGGWDKAKTKFGRSSREARDARNAFFAYREKRFKGVAGGEAIIGGLTQTMAIDKYFTDPGGASFGKGPKAKTEQKLWQSYVSEVNKLRPDLKKCREIYTHFSAQLKGRDEDRQRVNDWIATIAVASDLRYVMRKSYSEYYEGPGNSAMTTMGQKKVTELERMIKKFYSDDQGERRKESKFGDDIALYFTDAHGLAFKMLEWTFH